MTLQYATPDPSDTLVFCGVCLPRLMLGRPTPPTDAHRIQPIPKDGANVRAVHTRARLQAKPTEKANGAHD